MDVHTHIYIYMHIYMQIYIYPYIYTYTQFYAFVLNVGFSHADAPRFAGQAGRQLQSAWPLAPCCLSRSRTSAPCFHTVEAADNKEIWGGYD